jgi:predicted methyltransferase
MVAAVAAEAVARSAIDGRITAATIQAPSTSLCNLRNVSATASLTGVHRAQGGTAVQGTSADVTLTTRTFTALLSRFASAEVTADPATGDLRISIGPGGILQVDETAALQGSAIKSSPASMSLMGRAVPSNLQAAIDGKLTIRRRLSHLPLNLEPRSVAVTGNGVQIHLTAGPATISPGKQDPARNCASS